MPVYQVDESNSEERFLSEELMEEEYPILYQAIQKWGASNLNVSHYRDGGVNVKVLPSDLVTDEELECKNE